MDTFKQGLLRRCFHIKLAAIRTEYSSISGKRALNRRDYDVSVFNIDFSVIFD